MLENMILAIIPVAVPLLVKGVRMFVEQVLAGKLPHWSMHAMSGIFGAAATAFEPWATLEPLQGGLLGLAGVGAHQVYKSAQGKARAKK